MSHGPNPVDRVEAALREIGDALATPDVDRLLAAEAGLSSALEALTLTSRLDAAGSEVRESIDRAYASLMRCRRLGSSLTAFARPSIDAAGEPVYTRVGAQVLDRPVSVQLRG
jgi:hypothetical protein